MPSSIDAEDSPRVLIYLGLTVRDPHYCQDEQEVQNDQSPTTPGPEATKVQLEKRYPFCLQHAALRVQQDSKTIYCQQVFAGVLNLFGMVAYEWSIV